MQSRRRRTLLGDALHRGRLAFVAHRAVGQIVAAADHAIAGDVDQRDGLGVARLEPHRGAGRNVQPLAVGLGAVEFQLAVGFDEMIMAADLDGPVAEIGDFERNRRRGPR